MKLHTAIICILLTGLVQCQSQGFINLNFESAVININSTPPPYPPFNLVASNAIPGWTAYINGEPQQYIVYNDITLAAAMVGLEGTNSLAGTPGVQGKYFILIAGSAFTTPASAAIGQTGLIPLTAASILFWGTLGQMQITFNNQPLAFLQTGSTGSYGIYAADISPYAGQMGELLFYAPFSQSGIIDNIQFSTTAVPEPSTLALAALGTLLLGCRRWQKSS